LIAIKNDYEIRDGYVVVFYTNRKQEDFEMLFDLDDLEKLKELPYSIFAAFINVGYYAATTEYLGMVDGKPKYKTIFMHRYVMGFPKQLIDHVNHETLDNRKQNLKLSDKKANAINRRLNKNNTTGYRNVTRYKDRFIVQLQINGKNKVFGKFDDVHEAGAFAELMREIHYGIFEEGDN
jgi:hypothetical protein